MSNINPIMSNKSNIFMHIITSRYKFNTLILILVLVFELFWLGILNILIIHHNSFLIHKIF